MTHRRMLSAALFLCAYRTDASSGSDLHAGEKRCYGGEACWPGNEYCSKPFQNAPAFHLMDQHGCGINDPNGPVFDPVHGVVHHFYQIHLAAPPGHGPDYGHFVSKDFIHWAPMPVAIWNGLDLTEWPPRKTPYDNEAIFTGSAIVLNGAGPGGKPGIVQIYPGLCNKNDWPNCETGTLLAQAVPADYVNDPLLTNWTKPAYNPIIENTQRDPSTPFKTPSGEWRLRTFDSKFYGAASDADLLAGKWYEIGSNPTSFKTCECPSFYPLPASTPGFEAAYEAAQRDGALPTHVHKYSCGLHADWTQLGTYDAGAPKTTGNFTATPGWEDVFPQRQVDQGSFYASKDNEYPTKTGGKRRINWGWVRARPGSTQSLPREITFNAAARTLEQAPIEELQGLRGSPAYSKKGLALKAGESVSLDLQKTAKQSEIVATFELPKGAATFGVSIGLTSGNIACTVDYAPSTNASAPFNEVQVHCADAKDVLRLLPQEKTVELRIFYDWTLLEAYFQKGRVAMAIPCPRDDPMDDNSDLTISTTAPITLPSAVVYPMERIWVSPEEVRNAPRVYPEADAGDVAIVV